MKRLFIVSDMIDPAKGSEFRIALKPLEILKSESCDNYANEITLIVPIRNDNIENLQCWLKEQEITNVIIKAVKFERQVDNGNHKSKYEFIKDLIKFYKQARILIPKNSEVTNVMFKCGQVNWFFYILFLVVFKRDRGEKIICAPVSGFSYIKLHDCIDLSFYSKLYYRYYNVIIWVARKIFKFLFITNRNYYFLFATYSDCKLFFSKNFESKIYSEIGNSFVHDSLIKGKSDTLKNLNLNENKTLLWSGHLVQRKNPILALEILSRVLEINQNLKIYFVGEGPLAKEVKFLMAHSGLIKNERFIYIAKLPRPLFLELIKQVNFVLITSLREVNSMFFLEALSESKTIIAFKNSGLIDFDVKSVHLIDTKIVNSKNQIAEFVNGIIKRDLIDFIDASSVVASRRKLEKNNFMNLLESL